MCPPFLASHIECRPAWAVRGSPWSCGSVAVRGSQRIRIITVNSSHIRTFHSDPKALRFHNHFRPQIACFEIELTQAMSAHANTQRVSQPLDFVGVATVRLGTGNLGLEQNAIESKRFPAHRRKVL